MNQKKGKGIERGRMNGQLDMAIETEFSSQSG